MTLALRYAVRSDVGLLREGNEDSAYAGPHLLAVADGMGGHAAGEVASAATITTIAALDTEHVGQDLAGAVAGAVASANLRLQELIHADPATEGMGTTLTAILWVDGHAALGHIGDSRAYLLRNGQFYQISHDHSLVQSLIDEGKITEEDAAVHPHRSLLLRALDGRTVAEPDVTVHETMPGDRYLLCSDGLSGVVSEQTLHETLRSVWDPDKAALQLIELAIKGGGPDNITCIVADVVDSATAEQPPTLTSVFAGAASNGSGRPLLRTNSPAGRAHVLTQTAPQSAIVIAHDDVAPRTPAGDADDIPPRRRWPIMTSLLALLIILIVGGAYLGWRYTQDQYYIGASDGNVAIFRGVNESVAGVKLYHVYDRTQIPLVQVPATDRQTIQATISASGGLAGAQRIVANIRSGWQQCQTANANIRTYNKNLSIYNDKLKAYKAKYHTDKTVKIKGKTHNPPTPPKGSPPTRPTGCPGSAPAGTGGTP
ncbi:MAG TPA: protein phosphatase 2C domain-containing protein [Trebonia sp.]